MVPRRWQSILGGGLWGPAQLLVTCGWPMGTLRVLRKVRVAPRTWRVQVTHGRPGTQRVLGYVDGVARAATIGREMLVTAPAGRTPQLDFRDAPAAWPPAQYPESVTLQWQRVSGATRYTVTTAAGTLLATILDDGRQYYRWTSGALADGAALDFRVTALNDYGAAGTALTLTTTHVTVPQDETEAAISYNGDLTFDVT